ncbi:hypothetical protein [Micromonospora sp. NPDC050200]|uniref:hypothetical protein n=1 Tax=Micromonospora sp. NPDC050200 TaxID=3155664 RepID=UPI0033C6FA16
MQEQTPSDPPRREPSEEARRRSPKATFTPPPTPAKAARAAKSDGTDAAPGKRRPAKAAPVVLFQPPAPEQPLPRQPRPAKDVSEPVATPPEATGAGPASGPTGHGGAGGPRKAVNQPDDPAHSAAPRASGAAEPTGPVNSGAATKSKEPEKAAPDTPVTPAARKTARKATPRKKTVPRTSAPGESPTTPPRKTAEPKKAAPRKATAAAEQATPSGAGPAAATSARPPDHATDLPAREPTVVAGRPSAASGRTRELDLTEIRSRLLEHPGFAPELLALAAVAGVGPRARDWVVRLRAAYPDAGPDGLARLATRRFVRAAGAGGAVAAVAGLFAPVAELAAVLWSQAGLVLHVAAAYGRDPLDAERAVELLVLTQVHPDEASARTALAAARAADGPGDRPWPRAGEAAWRLAAPLAAQAGGWAALRLASRLLPGAAVLAAAAGDAAVAERLAARAVAAYRPVRAS